jgi:hypothetical protein
MDVGVELEFLAPAVQKGGEADLGSEMLAIGGSADQGLGRRSQEQVIDYGLILISDWTDSGRKAEHEVKIRDRQKLAFARGKP